MRILQYPDRRLCLKSSNVIDTGDLGDLCNTMYRYMTKGIMGIAAVQLGRSLRIISFRYGNEIRFLVNPVIIHRSSQVRKSIEGCLSIAKCKMVFVVLRHKRIKVDGFDLHLKPVVYRASGTLSLILQHEIDHLDGMLVNFKGSLLSA